MNPNPVSDTAMGIEIVFKATMELYQEYMQTLEKAIESTPLEEADRLAQLYALAQEAKEALEHDLAIFDKAVAMDMEGLTTMDDQLKIQELQNKLKG